MELGEERKREVEMLLHRVRRDREDERALGEAGARMQGRGLLWILLIA